MKALYTSGDIEMIELRKAVESAGFIFDFSKSKTTNRICCCRQIYKIFSNAPRESDFYRFLEIIKSAWHGDPDSLRKEILGGMWIFYITYKGDIDMKYAADKFAHIPPIEIFRDGKLYKDYPGDSKYAYVLAQRYNAKQRKKKIDLNKLIAV